MSRQKTNFICQNCGASYPKWTGRCDNCGQWNTLVEQVVSSGKSTVDKSQRLGSKLEPTKLSEIADSKTELRISTGVNDLDTVLGGGIVRGGVMLMAGQPGIGKSTLLLQVMTSIAKDQAVLYVSGEESANQIRLRADRLNNDNPDKLQVATSTTVEDIAASIRSGEYQVVVVDSIQTMSLSELTSAPGTVSQITNSSNVLIRAAKESSTAVVIVGHVTKEGSIAGPKVLEHLVDVVLQFEGDRYGGFKVVRAVKNRYGSTSEAAIFEMSQHGLEIVKNPSATLLSERQNTDGSIVLATLEGTRPLLVEIQALVNETNFGYPKRTASGFDINRLNLLVAVLEQRTKLSLSSKDIYVNVVGGLKLQDQAADLAVCMAIASAAAGRSLDEQTVVFGEVGLGGEVRSAVGADRRVAEAKKLGFTRAIAPKPARADSFIKPVVNLRTVLIDYLQK